MSHEKEHAKVYSHDVRQLLLEICLVIETNEQADDVLKPVLLMLSDFYHIEDGAFTIFDRESNEVYIDIALGLSDIQQMRGRYKPGEGIIGEVVSTGRTKIVPKTHLEPKFLGKTKPRMDKECSFICVPILYHREVTGTLSLTLNYSKDFDLETLAEVLTIITTLISQPLMLRKQLAETKREIETIHRLQSGDAENITIIGNSRGVRKLRTKLYRYAHSDVPVLFIGENGTGKSFWARALHATSARNGMPIAWYTCSQTDANDDACAIFGVRENTREEKKSSTLLPLISRAENSTLVLEGIEFLSARAQLILLQFLRTKEILIDGEYVKFFTRCAFTASHELERHLKLGRFNSQLYELISLYTLRIPALHERKDDIMIFSDRFLQEASRAQKKNIKRFSTPAIELLSSYHWPGNLNELQQVIMHTVRICKGGVIHAHMLPPSLQSAQSSNTIERHGLQEAVAQFEKDIIIDALKITGGNMTQSSRLLKVSDRILGLRIKKYGIMPSRYR